MQNNLKQLLFSKFCLVIIDYLTNQNLSHEDEHWLTLNEAENFINNNIHNINIYIQEMMEDYEVEGFLEELYNVEKEWIEDYLFVGEFYENIKNARFI